MESGINQNTVEKFNKGDELAFKAIYHLYRFRVYEYARKWLADAQDAEDVTAETFVKLWNKKSEFESIENIAGFLFIATRNSCYDHLRHQKMKQGKEPELIRELNHTTDFDLQEIREEFLKLIYVEVEKLPVKMKEIFLLSYLNGLKPAKIAEMLNISVQTVSNQKTNALKQLKQALVGNQSLSILFSILFV